MVTKSNSWDFYIPGDGYSGRYNYSTPVTERTVREDLRRSLGVNRLPVGTDVYVLGPQARQIISENMKQTSRAYAQAGQIADF
jgi:hypothetical protein